MFIGFYATWSPRPFDDLGQPGPDALPLRRPLGLSPAQWLGLLGSLLLFGGVFLPAFGPLSTNSVSLFRVGLERDGAPIDAVVILLLAALSLWLSMRDHCLLLFLTGIGAELARISSYLLWEPPVASARSWELCCFQMPGSGLQIGWWVMELGLILLLVAGFLAELPPLRHWKPMPPTTESGQFLSSGTSTPT